VGAETLRSQMTASGGCLESGLFEIAVGAKLPRGHTRLHAAAIDAAVPHAAVQFICADMFQRIAKRSDQHADV